MRVAIVLVSATTAIIAIIITTVIIVKLLSKETTYIIYIAELAGVALVLKLAADKPYKYLTIFTNN